MKKAFVGKYGTSIMFFLLSWITTYLIMFTIPAEPRYPNKEMNFLINLFFVITIIIVSILTNKLITEIGVKSNSKTVKYKKLSKKKLNFIIDFSSISSLIGIVLILYDRIFIRGIDYSVGLRNARYQWLSSTGGSLSSILGNILVSFSFVALIMGLIHWERVKRLRRYLFLLSGFSVPFIHAALNGGRSNVFILVMSIICVFVLRKSIGMKFLPEFKGKYIKIVVIGFLSLFFAIQIFDSSAKLASIDSAEYSQGIIYALRGELNDDLVKNSSRTPKVIYDFSSIGAYLIHGQWVAQESYVLSSKPGKFTVSIVQEILRVVKLYRGSIEPNAFSDIGTFISLPGALHYDYGLIGVLCGSVILGNLYGIALILLRTNYLMNGFTIAFVFEILMLLFLSPLFIANGLMYFNFIIFGFLSIEVLSKILFGKSSWLIVES